MGNQTGRKIRTVAGGTIVFDQSQAFDELGRLLRHLGAGTQTTTLAYDRTGNLTSVTDPRAGLYATAYDGLQRVIRETDQGAAQVNLTRNPQDAVTAYSDPRSLVTSYVRNGFGDVIRETSPDTGITDLELTRAADLRPREGLWRSERRIRAA